MANDKAITADSVASVLESARIQRQSGRLLVGQFIAGKFQEGEIYLQEGQPFYARLGTLSGKEAFDRLISWRNVQFTFTLDTPRNGITQLRPPVDTGSFTTPPASSPARAALTPIPPQRPDVGNGFHPELLIPQKRPSEENVLTLPLTRPQRFVYFLVDGRRTVGDISRCTGKSVPEIERILGELQARGLVAI
jgi:hypothetical protein